MSKRKIPGNYQLKIIPPELQPFHEIGFEVKRMSISKPRLVGIYFLFSGSKLVYVGSSTHIQNRVSDHFGTKDFDSAYCVTFSGIGRELLERIENGIIGFLRPPYNKKVIDCGCDDFSGIVALLNESKILPGSIAGNAKSERLINDRKSVRDYELKKNLERLFNAHRDEIRTELVGKLEERYSWQTERYQEILNLKSELLVEIYDLRRENSQLRSKLGMKLRSYKDYTHADEKQDSSQGGLEVAWH